LSLDSLSISTNSSPTFRAILLIPFLNKSFDQTVIDTLAMKEGLHLVKSNFNKFKNKPSYWNLSKGKSGDYTIHYLQVYVKTEIDEYFTISTKFFGDNDITDKLCASVSLFDQIKFIE
jgi:hypothetical protein